MITNSLGQPLGEALPDWQPCPPPPTTVMTGTYCDVVPLDVTKHAAQLFEAFSADTDAANWTYLPYGPFSKPDEFTDWLQDTCTGSDPLFHTVINKITGQAEGLASYLRIEPDVGVIEVGHIHFSPLMQRTPISTEAMYLMMRRVFSELGYRRYEWKCNALNQPSRDAAARLGFQFEGIFRQATISKNHNRDTAWFSILDSEWPALQQAFERWLAPDNFNEAGEQQQALARLR